MTLNERHVRLDPWRRRNYREDDSRPIMAQVVDSHTGFLGYAHPWPTHEPRVRMDIQTAVRISALSDRPLGPLELLTDSEPACLDEQVWPIAPIVVENIVMTTDRWRSALVRKARDAREARIQDWPAYERRAANRLAIMKETKAVRVADTVIAVLVVGVLITLACLIPVWLAG